MTNKPLRIELTFGKNDEDIYNWISEKDIANATFVKRLLRERMNEENGLIVARPVVESKPVVVEQEIEPEIEQEKEKPAFAFMEKMQGNDGGREF